MAREGDFQSKLIKEIKTIFPGSFVLKNDPNYIQGFPDLLILSALQSKSGHPPVSFAGRQLSEFAP